MLTRSDALLFGIIILAVVEIALFFRKNKIARSIIIGLLIMYLTLALSVTLFPIPFQEMYDSGYTHNFIPFKSIVSSINAGIRPFVSSVLGNVVLTMPFGFLMTILVKNKSFKNALIFIISFSVIIEALQFCIGLWIGYWYRNVDVDDLILNTIGGIIGWGIYRITPKKLICIFE